MIKWLGQRRPPDVTDEELKRQLEREQEELAKRIRDAGVRHVQLLTETPKP